MQYSFNYDYNLNDYKIHDYNSSEQYVVFTSGHPSFHCPDFGDNPDDIWLVIMDYFEKKFLNGENIHDQNGGEVHKIEQLGDNKYKCTYTAYEWWLTDDNDIEMIEELPFEIEGYIVSKPAVCDGDPYFLITSLKYEFNGK